MISQGYTPYCAALSPHHSVGVCLCVCVLYMSVYLENATYYRKKWRDVHKQTYST